MTFDQAPAPGPLWFTKSTDAGKTFSAPSMITGVSTFQRENNVAVDQYNGNIYTTYFPAANQLTFCKIDRRRKHMDNNQRLYRRRRHMYGERVSNYRRRSGRKRSSSLPDPTAARPGRMRTFFSLARPMPARHGRRRCRSIVAPETTEPRHALDRRRQCRCG